mgnify:CR=1 FL=1|jgi:type IX secretion system PorP/SprF family membrane protein
MKRLLLCLALLVGVAMNLQAQQDVRYSQYMFNKQVLNPAYTGCAHYDRQEVLSATVLLRQQWVNIDGAPTSASLSLHSPLGKERQMGLGGFLEYDAIGVHTMISAFGTYAYKFGLGSARLSIGLSGGVHYLNSAYSQIEGNEQVVIASDNPSLFQDETRIMPNFGLGLYYYSPDKYYIGASVPHLLRNTLRDDIVDIVKTPFKERYYNITAGYVFGRSNVKIVPSILVKMVPNQAPVQLDANVMVLLKNILWLGTSYRVGTGNANATVQSESIDFIVAFELKNGLKIGYAYDYTLSNLNQYTSGSHEIMLGWDRVGKGPRFKTPRHF